MLYYIGKRLLSGLLVFVIVIIFTFSLQYFVQHGALAPAYLLCAQHLTHSCLYTTELRYGLNQPYFVRLWDYFSGILFHFNLGPSYTGTISTVQGILKTYIPRTFWLAFVSLFFSILIAIPLGVWQAWKRNSRFDYIATGVVFVFYATPAFVLGTVLIGAFAVGWPHLPDSPIQGNHDWGIFTNPNGFILPVVALVVLSVAGLSRYMRSGVIDVVVQDYIRTARAKGCSTRQILFNHALRNALNSIVTIIGLSIPGLLSGALIIEVTFNYAGLGFETLNAATLFETPVVLGITIVVTALTVLGNFLADIALVFVNPRIRIEGAA